MLGIDLGIGGVMAENLRSGLVRETFKRNAESSRAMQEMGSGRRSREQGSGGGSIRRHSAAKKTAGEAIEPEDDCGEEGEENGPDEDVDGDFNQEDGGGLHGAEAGAAGRGHEERNHRGTIMVEDAVDLHNQGFEKAEDGSEKSGEADGMGAPEGHGGIVVKGRLAEAAGPA